MDRRANTQTSITFIGFGEVGQTFARGLLLRDDVHVSAYDRLFGTDAGKTLLLRAAELGVQTAETPEAVLPEAHVIVSAVTASEAEAVAEDTAALLRSGQIFLDVNSAAPATKQRAARHIEQAGGLYVEGAVMAPVLKPGIEVPILAGGPHAEETARLLNRLGMNLTPVAREYGRASAMKLCRSIMIKGIEALMVDCAAACEAQDVKAYVFDSLSETFPSIDWPSLADTMRERVARHGLRRAAEMREAGEMLASLGMSPDLAFAVADAQQRGAKAREG